MIRNGDWANFALRCDEALALRQRDARLSGAAAEGVPEVTGRSPFERSFAERRESALGLARFKLAQGLTEQARAIAQQFGLAAAEVGLTEGHPLPKQMLRAA